MSRRWRWSPRSPLFAFRGRKANLIKIVFWEARRQARDTDSRPLIEAMKPWLEEQLCRVPPRGGLAEVIRYTLARRPALCRFLDDGHIELDNNPVERDIRPVALGRSGKDFASSEATE